MKSKRGFTFVELIIVAVIIMILAAIAVPNFMEAQTRAVVARTHADLGMVRMTINTYQTEHRKLPQNKEAGVASGWDLVVLTCLLYTSDAADDLLCVDLGGRR